LRPTIRWTRAGESGFALLAVLVLIVVVAGASASFIWFMNQQQARAGARLRSGAAAGAAEAGVHRALSILESIAPDGRSPGRRWRPTAYTERLAVGPFEGRFTLSITDSPGGSMLITSAGEVGGITRRLRVRVHLASPALLAALHGASFVRIEQPPAATFILPYGAGIGDRPWVHIAAGREIWFATTDVSINNPNVSLTTAPGPVDAPDGANSATAPRKPGPVRLLVARGAELTLGETHQRADIEQLRTIGVYVDGVVLRTEALPPLPVVDAAYYRSLAAANAGNAALNEAAGKYHGDTDLAAKRDSLYSALQFEEVQTYLKTGPIPPRVHGVIYVSGGVALLEGQRLQITEGALVTEGTVRLGEGASLEVTHTAATRTLPGIMVLGHGALFVSGDARLRVHGLVYASRVIDINEGAAADIVGAVMGNDAGLSFRNTGATVVIRYDPAVLGTPGLRVADEDPVVAWIAAWEELP
jgi:fructose-specific component phosphotransferase system IIB-like protein